MNIQSNYVLQRLVKDRWEENYRIARANRMIKVSRKEASLADALEALHALVKGIFRRSAKAQS